MKILTVCEGIWPPLVNMSGISAIYQLQKALADLGFEIHVLTTKERHMGSSFQQWFESEKKDSNINFHCIDLGFVKAVPKVNFYTSKLVPPFEVLRLHSKHRFSVIHEYSSSIILARRTALYKSLLDVPVIHTLCTYSEGYLGSPRFSRNVGVDKIVCVTHDMEKILLNDGYSKNKIAYLPLGIDLRRFDGKNSGDTTSFVQKLPIPAGAQVTLYVGLIEQRKGIFTLAEAASSIIKKNPDAFFVVASYPFSGNFYDYNQNKVKLTKFLHERGVEGRFYFLDRIANIPLLMSIADVFVSPLTTLHGTLGYPLSLLEAMASGKAIVASKITGITELIVNQQNGLLFSAENAPELAEKVSILLSDKTMRRRLGTNAMNDVKKYDVKYIAKMLGKMYEGLKANDAVP
jgi:glycosyltransferase involved in cell wall biosynthesis